MKATNGNGMDEPGCIGSPQWTRNGLDEAARMERARDIIREESEAPLSGKYDDEALQELYPWADYSVCFGMPNGWMLAFGAELINDIDLLVRHMSQPLPEYEGEPGAPRADDDYPYPDVFCVTQVKEKFGELRFYVDGGADQSDLINDLIGVYSTISARTCVGCGSYHDVRMTRGWVNPICRECYWKRSKAGRHGAAWGDLREPDDGPVREYCYWTRRTPEGDETRNLLDGLAPTTDRPWLERLALPRVITETDQYHMPARPDGHATTEDAD